MFYSLLLLTVTYCLARIYQNNSEYDGDITQKNCGWIATNEIALFSYFALSAYIILFSGLRSGYNDTHAYIIGFRISKSSLTDLIHVLSKPQGRFLFSAYNILIKMLVGNNYARYLTVTAWITCGSFILFFRKYSSDFSLMIFLLIASTFLSFSYAALRQCFAVAIAIWAVPNFIQKRMVRGVLILMAATCIHTFVFLYIVALFLVDDVWTKKTVLIILATFLAAASFSNVFNEVAEITGYDAGDLAESAGTNVFRTLVWIVPVVLSFLYRDSINKNCNVAQKLFINMSLIGSMLMVIATFGGANLIGRTAYYFYPFFALSFSEIIHPQVMGKKSKTFRSLCLIGFFAYFFALEWSGLGHFFYDTLRHNSLFALFASRL